MIRRNTTRFTIMAAGPKMAGKTTFFNNIVGKNIIKKSDSPDINIYLLNLDCEGIVQKISFIDTPGFDSENDFKIQNNIIQYIQEQYNNFINEESKIRRNPKYEDTRVHCLLYLIPSTGSGLKQREIEFLKKLSPLVNIIPIISKADGLSNKEAEDMKIRILDQFKSNEISLFDLENNELLPQSILDLKLNASIPFTAINADDISGDRVRMHPFGEIDVDSPSTNDSAIIREVILSSHLDSLIEMTNNELYENYRVKVLESSRE